jgi:hypothetical protein
MTEENEIYQKARDLFMNVPVRKIRRLERELGKTLKCRDRYEDAFHIHEKGYDFVIGGWTTVPGDYDSGYTSRAMSELIVARGPMIIYKSIQDRYEEIISIARKRYNERRRKAEERLEILRNSRKLKLQRKFIDDLGE